MISSAEEFVRLRTSPNPDDYRRAADDEATVAVWLDVIDQFPDMRSWVAHNKSVPVDVLAALVGDPDADVRCVVASRRKLTDDLFRRLCADPDEGVRARLAWNAKIPMELLKGLESDASELVREAARDSLARRQGR